jgi:hypothetical protein
MRVSAVRGRTFNHEFAASSDASSAPLIGDDPSMTLLLFLKRTKEADRTPNKGRQVDSSLVCFRSQALELMGFGVDNAV